ncbi:hypothetical protein CRYUN_Cryun34aG0101500 [Craigia yunnanensis]
MWLDWSKPSDRERSLTPISPAVSPQPVGPIGPIGQNVPMASQQQRSFYPLGSGMNSYNRGYLQSGLNQGPGFGSASVPSLGAKNNIATDYKDAKFFIIKSYSEDNVHKSIKYGVWASTPNGNKKLDAAYRKAKENQNACPVFLLVSVKLEQGIEMLNIFRSYETDMSILDDFDFYEDRQKAMQERKARQQLASFVCLDDGNKEGTAIERTTSASYGSKGARVKLEDAITEAVSSAQAI